VCSHSAQNGKKVLVMVKKRPYEPPSSFAIANGPGTRSLPPLMNWTKLTDLAQLDTIDVASHAKPILIFKHSTRCSISSTALARMERGWPPLQDADHTPYYLDLLAHRPISNMIAERYDLEHESPQVLVIRHGKCVYSASHLAITPQEVVQALAA
jgi:bacillithiol system protein YtxJ